jgi:hypothetical protein
MTQRWMRGAACAVAVLALSGCAKITDKAWRVVSAKMDAFAIINEQLLSGEVALAPDRTGTVMLNADKGQPASCVGPVRYTSTKGSVVDLRCNDGAMVELRISMLTDTKGYAYGQTATGGASMAFGLDPLEAKAYLTVPANKKLVDNLTSGGLELQ